MSERQRNFRRVALAAIIMLALMPVIMPVMPALAAGGASTNGGAMFEKVLPGILMFMRVLGIGSAILGMVMLIWSYIDGNPAGQKPALVMVMGGAFLFGLQMVITNAKFGSLIDV
jgi:hypothetical protein